MTMRIASSSESIMIFPTEQSLNQSFFDENVRRELIFLLKSCEIVREFPLPTEKNYLRKQTAHSFNCKKN